MPSLARGARLALAALAVLTLACGASTDEPSLAEAAEALCEAARRVDFSEGTWTNQEVREALEDLLDELRDIDVPDELRDYRSAQIEAVEAAMELLCDADDAAAFVPSAGAFALAYGDGFTRASATLSEETAAPSAQRGAA